MNSCPKIISSDLANHTSQKGEELQKNPKRIYVSLTNEATKLKTQLKEASTDIKDYLYLCYYNSGNFHPQTCEGWYRNNYKWAILWYNKWNKTKEKKIVINWLWTKIFDDICLNKTIEYIISKFKRDIIDENNSSKDRVVVEELEQKKKEEDIVINR